MQHLEAYNASHQFLGLRAPYVIYVETFARVKTLSLSGKLIRPFADRLVEVSSHLFFRIFNWYHRFLTQWPEIPGETKPRSSDNWLV